MAGSYKCSPDSESEISLKIGQNLMKLRQTKKCASFWTTMYYLCYRRYDWTFLVCFY